jgi:hypothetical protein
MKSFLLITLLSTAAQQAVAFVLPSSINKNAFQSTTTTTSLSAVSSDDSSNTSRRSMLTTTLATVTTAALTTTPQIASAFETYLTEPTDEFKESERQRMEFRKKQLQFKAAFVEVLARLTGESKTEEELITDLKELKSLVTATGGLPLGIKKEDMYKVIRSKKAKGFWPTDVEIA